MDKLLKTSEVAAILRCSDDTVVALIRSGRLAAIDIGAGRNKCYRISVAAIEELSSTRQDGKIVRPEIAPSRFLAWKKSRRVS